MCQDELNTAIKSFTDPKSCISRHTKITCTVPRISGSRLRVSEAKPEKVPKRHPKSPKALKEGSANGHQN